MPAAAVIPAPGAYTKVVAVKKLVVGTLRSDKVGANGNFQIWPYSALRFGAWPIYLEEIRVFTAGLRLECCSMG